MAARQSAGALARPDSLNHLLRTRAARPRARAAFPGLHRVELELGQILYESGERVREVHFPIAAVVSLLTFAPGVPTPVEVGLIGREGMVGLPLALGASWSRERAQVQAAGAALRASGPSFLAQMRRDAGLRRGVYRFTYELSAQVMQTAACSRHHSAGQRFARWLLMMRDRAGGDRLRLTQKFLGYMVGMRRAGVSEAASALERRGLIRWRRGAVEILDRAGLQRAACGCYAAIDRDSR